MHSANINDVGGMIFPMIVLNFLIIGLTVITSLMIKYKSRPIMVKYLQSLNIILFSYAWGIGGYIEYPFLANLAGFSIIYFWLCAFSIALYKLGKRTFINSQ